MSDKYMKNLTFANIAKACEGTYIGDETLLDTTITGAVIDSRQVKEGYLFIPIKGERVDGHKFIPTVFEQGAAIVLSEHELKDPAGPYVLVESTTDAMKKLAAFYRKSLDIKVVGITGSVGKTSTKEMISSVLEQKYSVHKTAGNFNNEIGLPLTIFGIRESHQVAVLEMGISDFGEMHRLSTMSCPDVMVITNIGYCHLEFLGDRDGVLKAKTECFEHMMPDAVAVLNADDDKLATVQTVNGKPAIYYGKESASGVHKSVYTTNIENLGFDGMKAHFVTPEGEFDAQIHIPGEHNVYNAMAAAAVGLQLGLTIAEIKSGIEKAETIAGRTNFIKTHGMTVIDDCYNANPVSMKSSIEVLSHAKGRTIAVLGDMGELGSDEKKLHHEVGEAVGENHIHTLFAAGELAKEYAAGAAEKSSDVDIHYFEDRETMTQELLSYVKEGDTILVKASHFMEFPKVVEALSKERKIMAQNPIVTITMENGDVIKAELYPEIAPNTVNNFISLINHNFYDGVCFHRVIKGFMLQGGDPDGNGTGGPGYEIKGEFTHNGFKNDLKHTAGVLSMARTMIPDSAGSQFFIMHQDAPHLDGEYAAFGKVIEGMDVVNKIAEVRTDYMDKPLEAQVMKTVTVETFGVDYPEPETV